MLLYRCKQMKGKESSISWVLRGAHGRLPSEKLLVMFQSFGFLVYYVILFYNRYIQICIYVDIHTWYIYTCTCLVYVQIYVCVDIYTLFWMCEVAYETMMTGRQLGCHVTYFGRNVTVSRVMWVCTRACLHEAEEGVEGGSSLWFPTGGIGYEAEPCYF